MALECVPEHGLARDAFGSRIEGRRQLRHRLFPPVGNETPAHRHQFHGATIGELDDIDGVGGSDVVVGLQIASGAREAVQLVDFAPRIALGEASAPGRMRFPLIPSGRA
jgi:hypothetical protein